jgi:hypothetical protein
LLNQHLAELVEASGLLLPTDKNYAVLTFDAGELPVARLHFESYYTEMLREGAHGDNRSV